jgi:hypothetical protein
MLFSLFINRPPIRPSVLIKGQLCLYAVQCVHQAPSHQALCIHKRTTVVTSCSVCSSGNLYRALYTPNAEIVVKITTEEIMELLRSSLSMYVTLCLSSGLQMPIILHRRRENFWGGNNSDCTEYLNTRFHFIERTSTNIYPSSKWCYGQFEVGEQGHICKTWGFHGGDYEEWSFLGCHVMWLL